MATPKAPDAVIDLEAQPLRQIIFETLTFPVVIEVLKAAVQGDSSKVPEAKEPIGLLDYIEPSPQVQAPVDDEWKKKWELEFFAMKEKVTEKMEGVSLSYEDVKANNWNLPKDFKMPKIKKYKGTENPQNHASHYLLTMTPFNLLKK